MGYWFISHLRGKTRPPIPTPTHCLNYQSYLPVQDKETWGVRNTLSEEPWQEKNRLIFLSLFFSPDNVLRSAESTGSRRRHARCCVNKKSPVIPLFQCEHGPLLHTHLPVTAVPQNHTEKNTNSWFLLFVGDLFCVMMCSDTQKAYYVWKECFYLLDKRGSLCPHILNTNQLYIKKKLEYICSPCWVTKNRNFENE